jgi:hypothetical protein
LSTDIKTAYEKGLSEENSYFYVSATVTGAQQGFLHFVLTEDAKKILQKADGIAKFRAVCGDRYVTSFIGGGEFSALITTNKLTQSETNEVIKAINLGIDAISQKFELEAEQQKELEHIREKFDMNVKVFRVGEINGESIPSITDPVALLNYAVVFADKLSAAQPDGNIAAYRVAFQKFSDAADFVAEAPDVFQSLDTSRVEMERIIKFFDAGNANLGTLDDFLLFPNRFKGTDDPATHQEILDGGCCIAR